MINTGRPNLQITMPLSEYRKKRDFKTTPEPKGARAKRRGHSFCIQKHDATRLHYDFRLEINGVLASWAVPKGPSLDPAEKRLAVQVEDHPLEYGKFEGTIPKGEYGGGIVMLWDRGKWHMQEDQGDPETMWKAGKLKVVLDGEKLKGGWTLVRMAANRQQGGKPAWLLIKEHDATAQPLSAGDILEALPNSVKTGRTMEEISAGRSVWHSDPEKAKAAAKKKTPTSKSRSVKAAKKTALASSRAAKSTSRTTSKTRSRQKSSAKAHGKSPASAADLPGARHKAFPKKIAPQLATLVADPPEGNEWLHEMKFDGYRMLCSIHDGTIKFTSRNGLDWTPRLASLVEQVQKVAIDEAIFDGEVVVLDSKGASHFQLLQNAFRGENNSPFLYYVFDLLYADGYDLTHTPLERRKELVEQVLAENPAVKQRIRYSEHIIGSGGEFKRQMCKAQLEGTISKRRDSLYVAGRTGAWLKSKCRQGQELVIGGFTPPSGSRVSFGSLLMGHYDKSGRLIYAGRVGTGFDEKRLKNLHAKMLRFKVPKPAFSNPPRGSDFRGVTWIKPELVAQVEFSNWTDEGLVRQGAFQDLRDDKPAREVRREVPK